MEEFYVEYNIIKNLGEGSDVDLDSVLAILQEEVIVEKVGESDDILALKVHEDQVGTFEYKIGLQGFREGGDYAPHLGDQDLVHDPGYSEGDFGSD